MTERRRYAVRRAFGLVLALCLLLSFAPVQVFAADEGEQEPIAEIETVTATEFEEAEEPEPIEEPEIMEEPEATEEPEAIDEPEAIEEPEAADESEEAEEPETADESEAEESEASESEVVLRILLVPETAELTVYAKEENGEIHTFGRQEDGSYRLLPGQYYYTLRAEGYDTLEEQPLLVAASDEPLEITLTLSETAEEAESETAVAVRFQLRPARAELTVLSENEEGEGIPVFPEEDGSYFLLPGRYVYTLQADGFITAEKVPFLVEASEETLLIEATLEAEIETFSALLDYVDALAALNREYGLTDDAVSLEQFNGGSGDPYLTRRLIVRTSGTLESGLGAVRILHRGTEYVLQYETEEEAREAYEQLRDRGSYESVARDVLMTREPDLPGAPILSLNSYTDQKHYSWGIAAMGLDALEDQLVERGAQLPSVTVAVIDSGVNAANGLIAGRLLSGYNFYDGNTDVTETIPHGTSVAGVIVDGTPDNVSILPLKVTGSNGKAPLLMVKYAVQYAVEAGVDVINLSMGYETTENYYLEELFAQAQNAGIVVCVSAGNDGAEASGYYPACSPLVLTIAAVDSNMNRAYYSNYGAVDFALPGSDIYTTLGGDLGYMSGTSFSCPHASAAAALLKSVDKSLSAAAIRSIFIEHSVALDSSLGFGFIDLSDYILSEPEDADPVEAFVRRCYRRILNRGADEEGVTYWAEQLRNRTATGASVVNDFLMSPEFDRRGLSGAEMVEILYRVMMNRAADEDGEEAWVSLLEAGVSRSYLVRQFAASAEFSGICREYGILAGTLHLIENRDRNPNVSAFVSRCYRLMLEREPDIAGLNDWCGDLLAGRQTGASLVDAFFSSPEFQGRALSYEELVNVLYRTMLNREADEAGSADWTEVLADGMSGHYIVNGFASAPEFINICTGFDILPGEVSSLEWRDRNPDVTRFVSRCYSVALERAGDAGGLNDWCQTLLTRALTPKQAAENFVFSIECMNRNLNSRDFVTLLYRLYMGREPDASGMTNWLNYLDSGRMTRQQVSEAFAGSPEFAAIVRSYGL